MTGPDLSGDGDSDYDSLRAEVDELQEEAAEIKGLPEVNPVIYRDVEPLLFRGFLVADVKINGVPFLFKSLNQHEAQMVSWSSGSSSSQDYLLAYAVFMVDGRTTLSNRESFLPELLEFFKGLNSEARREVVRCISELQRRSGDAIVLTEAYAMESSSRWRWSQLHGLDLTTTAVTGVVGTNNLGLNWAQLLWRALNRVEDQKATWELDWDHAKFIASPMAGKEIRKVYTADRTRKKGELDERVARREALIRYVLLGEAPNSKPKGDIQVARTVSELSEQLRRSLAGEQDWHDKVIAVAEEQARQSRQQRLDQMQQMYAERADSKPLSVSSQVGLSYDQAANRVLESQKRAEQGYARLQAVAPLLNEDGEDPKAKWYSAGIDTPATVDPSSRKTPFSKR